MYWEKYPIPRGCLVLRLDTSAIRFLRSQLIQMVIFQGINWNSLGLYPFSSVGFWLTHLLASWDMLQTIITYIVYCSHAQNMHQILYVFVFVSQIQRLKSLWMWQVDNVNDIMLNAIYSRNISQHIMEIHDFDIDRLAQNFRSFLWIFFFIFEISSFVGNLIQCTEPYSSSMAWIEFMKFDSKLRRFSLRQIWTLYFGLPFFIFPFPFYCQTIYVFAIAK